MGVVRTSARPETVAEVLEVFLVDRREHPYQRLLHGRKIKFQRSAGLLQRFSQLLQAVERLRDNL